MRVAIFRRFDFSPSRNADRSPRQQPILALPYRSQTAEDSSRKFILAEFQSGDVSLILKVFGDDAPVSTIAKK